MNFSRCPNCILSIDVISVASAGTDSVYCTGPGLADGDRFWGARPQLIGAPRGTSWFLTFSSSRISLLLFMANARYFYVVVGCNVGSARYVRFIHDRKNSMLVIAILCIFNCSHISSALIQKPIATGTTTTPLPFLLCPRPHRSTRLSFCIIRYFQIELHHISII